MVIMEEKKKEKELKDEKIKAIHGEEVKDNKIKLTD
ncbi:hypothetical protein FUSNEC_GEN_294_06015 [Fusobacterium necrophorum subsp. funduliforme]